MNEQSSDFPMVTEAQMPSVGQSAGGTRRRRTRTADLARLALASLAAFVVVFVYIGVPIALLAGNRLDSLLHAALVALAVIVAATAIILGVLHSTNLDVEQVEPARRAPVRVDTLTAIGGQS